MSGLPSSRRIDLRDLRHVIVNHTEPDHSGSIKELLRHAPHVVVHGTRPALQFLSEQVNMDFNQHVVGENDVLDLGDRHCASLWHRSCTGPTPCGATWKGKECSSPATALAPISASRRNKILASQQEVDFTGAVVLL